MENDALFSNIPEITKHMLEEYTALAQINNTNRQKIRNNNINSTNNSVQRLTVDQIPKRARLQRDSSNSEDVQRRSSHLSNSRVFMNRLVDSVYLRP
ncbi:hypothetical protein AVEN_23632-1 [Araneus ventricosus]|uniref:Uncharacterized protein n=1 Tax=Araneus ventricosus TaxID=182803 RepID=A0A4Y2BH54_ARAVE|nr:hypothetical protein AVEN_23632-1 [Araneus ventricosus]